MGNIKVEVEYSDGDKVYITPLSFEEVMEFTEIQTFLKNPIDNEVKFSDIVDFFKPHILLGDGDIRLLNLNSFRELVVMVLTISMPDNKVYYNFMCDNLDSVNIEKVLFKDKLNILGTYIKETEEELLKYKEGDDRHKALSLGLKKDKTQYEEDLQELESMESTIPCESEINGSVDMESLKLDIPHLYKNKHRVEWEGIDLHEYKVIHKLVQEELIGLENILGHIVDYNNIPSKTKMTNILPHLKEKKGAYVFTPQLEDYYILLELLVLAGHMCDPKKLIKKGVEELAKAYDFIKYSANDKVISLNTVLEVYKTEKVKIATVCLNCNKKYSVHVSIEDFNLKPN